MSSDQNRNDSLSSRFFSLPSLIRRSQNRDAGPSSVAAQPEAATDDDSMPALSAGVEDSDDEDDAPTALQQDLLEPMPTFTSIPVVILPVASTSRTTTTNGQSLSTPVPNNTGDMQASMASEHHRSPRSENSPLSSPSSLEVAPDSSQGGVTSAPSGAAPDVPLPSTVRDRRVRDSEDQGYDSEGSLPSLQTVSDSSDEGWTDEESDEDESDEDEDEEGEGGEDRPDEDSAFNSLPRLGPSIPPGAARFMQTLTAVAEAREGWVGMDLENGGDEDGDHFDPISILAGPGGDPLSRIIAPPGGAAHRSGFILNTMRQVIDALGSPAIPETDPKRAELITKSLEVISEDLVRRYEKLRAGQEGEENEGCAVCRESFLDPTAEETAITVQFAELPYPAGDEPSESTAKILAFPCPGMHLFHSHCISPWLERKTTCPTCRFDVDPDSLTLTFLREIRQRSNHPLANSKWSAPQQKSFRRWLEREEKKLSGEELSDSDSDSEEVEEYINGSRVEAEDDLPPLVADQFAATTATPDSATTNAGAPRPAPANRQPSRGPPVPADVADFYNIDPIVRENMLAALIPIMDMTMDIEPEDESESGSEWEDDEDDEDDDEDDDLLPPLIPVGRNVPSAPAHAPAFAAFDESDVDDELPALVDAILAGSAGDVVPPAPSTEPLFDDDDDDDELPELIPVRPRGAPAQPSAAADEDDDELPDLVGEIPRRRSLEDID